MYRYNCFIMIIVSIEVICKKRQKEVKFNDSKKGWNERQVRPAMFLDLLYAHDMEIKYIDFSLPVFQLSWILLLIYKVVDDLDNFSCNCSL